VSGDEGLDREALPVGESVDTSDKFWDIVRWQAHTRTTRSLSTELMQGRLGHDEFLGADSTLGYLLAALWLRPKPPRRG
jgi:hypothetical protein